MARLAIIIEGWIDAFAKDDYEGDLKYLKEVYNAKISKVDITIENFR